jgi:hypothetical protein
MGIKIPSRLLLGEELKKGATIVTVTTFTYLVSRCFSGKLGISSFAFWNIFYHVFVPLHLVKRATFLSCYRSTLSELSTWVLEVYVPILIFPAVILNSALT